MSEQGRISSAPERRKGAGKIFAAAIAAQSVEFYDFMIYGTAASLVFNKTFFPSVSPVAGVLAAFATFAVGFAGRPFGAVVFGHIGDRFGRKPALIFSTASMAVATTLIGVLPTFALIGVFAPILLVLLRVVQGVAVGGVWGGATLLAVEGAPAERRGLFGAIPQIGTFGGMVAGSFVFAIVSGLVSAQQFAAWGWRVPFLLSIVLFPVVVFIHRYIEDSPDFKAVEQKLAAQATEKRSSVLDVLRRPKQMLTVLFIFVPATVMFYATATGMLDYGVRTLHLAKSTMLDVVMLSLIVTAAGTVLFGWLSDRVGRRAVYCGGAAFAGIWSFLIFPLADTRSFGLVVLSIAVGQLTVGAMYGAGVTLFAEMFPPRIRYSGASLGYQLANVVGGGLAPFVMVALLSSTGSTTSVAVYIAATCVISLIALATTGLRRTAAVEAEPVARTA